MELLMKNDKAPRAPAALIHQATTPGQRALIGTVSDIADHTERENFKPPAIAIMEEAVALRDKLHCSEDRPLFGKKIMITRSAAQSGKLADILTERGAMVIECPTIRIEKPKSWKPLDMAIRNFSGYDWVILTSGNAVHAIFQRIDTIGLDARVISKCKVCAVGPGTADVIRSFGIRPDLVASDHSSEGVVAEFSGKDMGGVKVLYPAAELTREIIPRRLREMGAIVDRPTAYRTILPDRLPPEVITVLEKRSVDCVTFTSPSTVKNLAELLGKERFADMKNEVAIASIGMVTSKACRELGLRVDIESSASTLTDLSDAIEKFLTD